MNKSLPSLLLAVLLACAAPAQAIEAPLAYARSPVKLILQRPREAANTAGALTLDTEIRNEESSEHTPGWYNFSTLNDTKAAMLLYAEPATATIESSTDYAPTDIMFVDAYGTIKQILPSLIPAQLNESISSPEPVLAVLYMKGGSAERLGIQPGDQVDYGLFRKRPVVISAPAAIPPAAAALPAEPVFSPQTALPADQQTANPPEAAPPVAEQPAAPVAAPAVAAPVTQPTVPVMAPVAAPQIATPPVPVIQPAAPVAAPAVAAPVAQTTAPVTVAAPVAQPAVAAPPPAPAADAEREQLIDKIFKQNNVQ